MRIVGPLHLGHGLFRRDLVVISVIPVPPTVYAASGSPNTTGAHRR
jgi:hypothetical protein